MTFDKWLLLGSYPEKYRADVLHHELGMDFIYLLN